MKIILKIIILLIFGLFAFCSFIVANMSEEERNRRVKGEEYGKDSKNR